jgi:hypothetical protein
MAPAEAEARTDASEIDRGTQERFAHASPICRKVVGVAHRIDIANGADAATTVRELSRDNRTFTEFLPVLELLLED